MLKRAAGIGGVRMFFDAESGRKSFALDPPEASLDVLHCLGEERVSPPVHLKYRPDIDGLRAIAVLSVVGFHAFPELVRSGFIGVDVFFVISGFLISTIIFSGLEGGEFNFLGFYSRRVKRIFPALLVVLLASYVFGWFALLASEYRQLGKHIAGGAGFVSNFILWGEAGYFDSTADSKPLLHLWSLGIEEQFYIVWPLFLWIVWKKKFNLFATIFVVFSVSFFLNIVTVKHDVIAAFYSPQTRFWELLVGSLLSYLAQYKQNFSRESREKSDRWLGRVSGRLDLKINGNALRNVQSLFGATLISIGLLIVTKEKLFPGWFAVLPTSGAFFLIAAGPTAGFNRTVLSSKILVWFGLISFPLYLWHWPLLSFVRIFKVGPPSFWVRGAVVLISIVLAWITYRFIEKPIRQGVAWKSKTFILLLLMIVVGFVGYNCYEHAGFRERTGEKQQHPLTRKNNVKNYNSSDEFSRIVFKDVLPCDRDFYVTGNAPGRKIAVIGDSHSNRIYEGLRQIGGNMINVGRGTCPPFLDVEVINNRGKESKTFDCQPLVNNYLEGVLAQNDIEVIVLSAFYAQYERDGVSLRDVKRGHVSVIEAVENTLIYLAASGKKIVFTLDVPELKSNCAVLEYRPFPIHTNEGACIVSQERILRQNVELRNLLQELAQSHKNIHVFDPADVLCLHGYCGEIDRNNSLYWSDGNHLTDYGSKLVGAALHPILQTIAETQY